MPTTTTTCPGEDTLRAFLHQSLGEQRASGVEDHLSHCERCQPLLESLSASEQVWTEASEHLRLLEEDLCEASTLTLDQQGLLRMLGPSDDPAMLGRIGSYEILGLIGSGGMGAVFKGLDRSLNRYVAIKVLLPHHAASPAARLRFAREAQAAAAVVDDHVMAVHHVDEWQGTPYLVMPYAKGVSLQKRLRDNGALEFVEILRIGMQAARGLAAAHAQGLVHRDVKPANIFLSDKVERVRLMDFGLARAVDDASLTRTGVLPGTPQFMSPEQARAEKVDLRSDLFSLGSVLYTMSTGQPPFRAESSHSVLRLITDKEPTPIKELNPDIPDWFCTVVKRLMAKDPCDRYKSSNEVAGVLETCLAHVQQPDAHELPTELRPTRKEPGFRSKFIAAGGAGAILAVMLLMAMLYGNGPKASSVLIAVEYRGSAVSRGVEKEVQKRMADLLRSDVILNDAASRLGDDVATDSLAKRLTVQADEAIHVSLSGTPTITAEQCQRELATIIGCLIEFVEENHRDPTPKQQLYEQLAKAQQQLDRSGSKDDRDRVEAMKFAISELDESLKTGLRIVVTQPPHVGDVHDWATERMGKMKPEGFSDLCRYAQELKSLPLEMTLADISHEMELQLARQRVRNLGIPVAEPDGNDEVKIKSFVIRNTIDRELQATSIALFHKPIKDAVNPSNVQHYIAVDIPPGESSTWKVPVAANRPILAVIYGPYDVESGTRKTLGTYFSDGPKRPGKPALKAATED